MYVQEQSKSDSTRFRIYNVLVLNSSRHQHKNDVKCENIGLHFRHLILFGRCTTDLDGSTRRQVLLLPVTSFQIESIEINSLL